MRRVLAVDDDHDALRVLVGALERDHEVIGCPDGSAAIRELHRVRFDLVIADLNMPPPDGFEVLRAAQRIMIPPPVIVVSALDNARSTLEAMRLGARDYLVKPVSPDEIRSASARILFYTERDTNDGCDFGLIGESAEIQRIRRLIPLLARSAEIVLILGETGTGKELLARALHLHGPRHVGHFVAHNMAATPSELVESTFFGHVRGAFSGAVADHAGLFEQAEGGTLFLDEVDSFPLALQAKLLRVLETGAVQRVGSATERPVNVRVLAASAVDPGELVARGTFRADLYYRFRQLEVVLPPLRHRREDIPLLTHHFLGELARQGCATQISPAAMESMLAFPWPGNCRELRNAVRSAALMAGGGLLLPGHLPKALKGVRPVASEGPSASLRDAERDHILQTLERAGGNRSLAARLLGIDRGTLARKLGTLAPRPKSGGEGRSRAPAPHEEDNPDPC